MKAEIRLKAKPIYFVFNLLIDSKTMSASEADCGVDQVCAKCFISCVKLGINWKT